MSEVIEYVTFNIIKGKTVSDFLLASDKLNSGFLAGQKGYISRKLLADGNMWADLVVWETMNDAQNALKVCHENKFAVEYMSFIENVDMHHLSVEKDYTAKAD